MTTHPAHLRAIGDRLEEKGEPGPAAAVRLLAHMLEAGVDHDAVIAATLAALDEDDGRVVAEARLECEAQKWRRLGLPVPSFHWRAFGNSLTSGPADLTTVQQSLDMESFYAYEAEPRGEEPPAPGLSDWVRGEMGMPARRRGR